MLRQQVRLRPLQFMSYPERIALTACLLPLVCVINLRIDIYRYIESAAFYRDPCVHRFGDRETEGSSLAAQAQNSWWSCSDEDYSLAGFRNSRHWSSLKPERI